MIHLKHRDYFWATLEYQESHLFACLPQARLTHYSFFSMLRLSVEQLNGLFNSYKYLPSFITSDGGYHRDFPRGSRTALRYIPISLLSFRSRMPRNPTLNSSKRGILGGML